MTSIQPPLAGKVLHPAPAAPAGNDQPMCFHMPPQPPRAAGPVAAFAPPAGRSRVALLAALAASQVATALGSRVVAFADYYAENLAGMTARERWPLEVLPVPWPAGTPTYRYPRNLGAMGPDGQLLVGDSTRYLATDGRPYGTFALHLTWEKLGLHVQPLTGMKVNFANLGEAGGQLVIARQDKDNPDCDYATHPANGCLKQERRLVNAFGATSTIAFEVAYIPHMHNGKHFSRCYDMDLYFSIFPAPGGGRVALIYPSCILEQPSARGARSGAVGRQKVLEKLRANGTHVIEMGQQDFENNIANLISLKPGDVLLSNEPTPRLMAELHDAGIIVRIYNMGSQHFGVHCLTLEIPDKPDGSPYGAAMVVGAASLAAAALIQARCAKP